MSNDVFVWINHDNGEADSIAWETLGVARKVAGDLGGQVVAVVLGKNITPLARQAVEYGADRVMMADDSTLDKFRLEPYAAVLTKLGREQQPAVLLMGASNAGLELAPYVAAKLGVGLAPDCTDLAVEHGSLVATRPALVGNVMGRDRRGLQHAVWARGRREARARGGGLSGPRTAFHEA